MFLPARRTSIVACPTHVTDGLASGERRAPPDPSSPPAGSSRPAAASATRRACAPTATPRSSLSRGAGSCWQSRPAPWARAAPKRGSRRAARTNKAQERRRRIGSRWGRFGGETHSSRQSCPMDESTRPCPRAAAGRQTRCRPDRRRHLRRIGHPHVSRRDDRAVVAIPARGPRDPRGVCGEPEDGVGVVRVAARAGGESRAQRGPCGPGGARAAHPPLHAHHAECRRAARAGRQPQRDRAARQHHGRPLLRGRAAS